MQEIVKKIILGTSDTWLTIHLSQRTSKPTYYIVDCQIFGSSEQDVSVNITLITTSELNMTRKIIGRAHSKMNLSHTL